jgi:hypothetical protein
MCKMGDIIIDEHEGKGPASQRGKGRCLDVIGKECFRVARSDTGPEGADLACWGARREAGGWGGGGGMGKEVKSGEILFSQDPSSHVPHDLVLET